MLKRSRLVGCGFLSGLSDIDRARVEASTPFFDPVSGVAADGVEQGQASLEGVDRLHRQADAHLER